MSGFPSQFFKFDEISFRSSSILDAHEELYLQALHVHKVVFGGADLIWRHRGNWKSLCYIYIPVFTKSL